MRRQQRQLTNRSRLFSSNSRCPFLFPFLCSHSSLVLLLINQVHLNLNNSMTRHTTPLATSAGLIKSGSITTSTSMGSLPTVRLRTISWPRITWRVPRTALGHRRHSLARVVKEQEVLMHHQARANPSVLLPILILLAIYRFLRKHGSSSTPGGRGSQPSSPTMPDTASNSNPASSPTKITVSVSLKDDPSIAAEADSEETVEILYPSNTYYCGASSEFLLQLYQYDLLSSRSIHMHVLSNLLSFRLKSPIIITTVDAAANSCSIACPSSKDDQCPCDLQCFGNTECMYRESFFCGATWLNASDTCSKPCPSGDALECNDGEACFAWTSCQNTDSFYCGVSFEDASSNCALACPSRSSLDCPDEQGCFAYTTCQGTNGTGVHEVDPLNVPMNDNFCGDSKELASSTCSVACQSGLDSDCPGDMKCHDGTGCSSRDSFWCGSTWMEAAEMCTKPCSSGSADECDSGESCFAHTGCQTNLFFRGHL